MNQNSNLSRRNFLKSSATIGTIGAVGAVGGIPLLSSCSSEERKKKGEELKLPQLLDQAPDGPVLKAGLVGCGGRGTGAAIDFLNSGPNLQIVALGDVFQDKIDACRDLLKKEKNVEIPDENCFVGFDSYEKVLDSGIDVVLLCTPPHFRPAHVEAAVNARKHIFMEKPVAVDPTGVRRVIAAVKRAQSLKLNIISGTIRRSQKDYMETRRRVLNGEIGDITGAHIIRNGGALWFRSRRPEWSDMEYMLRNWVNFCWLSGDHITEQFIHEIDVMNWYLGKYPIKASGWGGRQRRVTGDQYDFFSIEYLYDNGMRTHCAARQIDGCSNGKVEQINCTNGYADAAGKLYDLNGNIIWEYPNTENNSNPEWSVTNPFVQEHINLVSAIRTGNTINDGEDQAYSTLVTIMGRVAAYTGKDVTWDEILNADIYLGPRTYTMGTVEGIVEAPPLAGVQHSE
ncbi:MAG: Gfo/Idh/MocA family oxidoreductase [Fermentimonas caenicola]|jgi:myo-inositol 2-dehydrogenase/D-chiro-inositol 1-dehydrogenase|uniref:Gfo/Idh/MocA family oxidoreductase n=1 Tax=Lascolabacillus sp. TaxID=1924068 RepID=UPI002585BE47|nr:Gfo/Idh/MocA family oxidoreductase [Lascolabacillus sp.]MCK9500938.1 Gfo/Idh/MocA family oxidoreductase [Lascolabacillus sp.]MDD3658747.1 Gfo/Idh/MocA family oxidoreductase [Lascolabacillus sp.]MDI9626782.1 Gfo/Idh/MocA family oxidoreductase [Bacteroidota bacterium]